MRASRRPRHRPTRRLRPRCEELAARGLPFEAIVSVAAWSDARFAAWLAARDARGDGRSPRAMTGLPPARRRRQREEEAAALAAREQIFGARFK